MTIRFSKSVVTATLKRHIKYADDGFNFVATRGWEQVERAANEKARRERMPVSLLDAQRAYGEWSALRELAEDLCLEVD